MGSGAFRSSWSSPTAPPRPIVVREEVDRPQPRLDAGSNDRSGMVVLIPIVLNDYH